MTEAARSDRVEEGLAALMGLLRFNGVASDAQQIRHRFGTDIGVREMLLCAKTLGLKARTLTTHWERLARTPMPAIAVLRDGRFLLLGKAGEPSASLRSSRGRGR
jgi:subfamily B ATP-binding cassette protein HlyB/CyaB